MPCHDLIFTADNHPTTAFAMFMRDANVPGTDLASINDALQARFFQKNPDGSPKERWELEKINIDCELPLILQKHLPTCGFMKETTPSKKEYDYAAWPGALVTRAAVRLNDLVSAWQNGVRWKQTIVFGGKRPLQTDKESYEACCKTLSIEGETLEVARCWWESINPKTELDMMKWLWRLTLLPDDFAGAEAIFVDAPMVHVPGKELGTYRRPTTEDTVQEWLKSNPKPGPVLLSSGAPYGMAMDEAFWMLLEPHGFTVETFGHAAPDLPVENFMREVAGTVNRIYRNRNK